MGSTGMPLDKAELLSVLLEALLYGFSLLMFGATIWTLLFQRRNYPVNRKMFSVACALFLCSTGHLVIHIVRVMDGLISYRDTFPGGPVGYFSNVSEWTFDAKNHVYTVQTLIGDGVILYRCYIVWQSKLVMIFPVILWCATGVTGLVIGYVSLKVRQSGVFAGSLEQWITAWWATALATNLLTTLLLVLRIWDVDRKAIKLRGHRQTQLRQILHILVDAGAIYTLTLLVALVCFVCQTDGQFVVLDMVTPIISITFYMVIIRVGLTTRHSHHTSNIPLANASGDHTLVAERKRRVQVHITTMTESKIDNQDQPASMYLANSSSGKVVLGKSNSTAEVAYDPDKERIVDASYETSTPHFSRAVEAVSYRYGPFAY